MVVECETLTSLLDLTNAGGGSGEMLFVLLPQMSKAKSGVSFIVQQKCTFSVSDYIREDVEVNTASMNESLCCLSKY